MLRLLKVSELYGCSPGDLGKQHRGPANRRRALVQGVSAVRWWFHGKLRTEHGAKRFCRLMG